MTKTSRIAAAMMVLVAAAGRTGAQPAKADNGFLNVDFGFQPPMRTITSSETRPVYGETATISSVQSIENGPMFGVAGGVRIRPRFGVGVGYSRFSVGSEAAVVARIPSPLYFGQLATATATQASLTHSENGIHPQVVFFVPVTDKVDVSFAAGPSFIMVSQDVPVVTIPGGTQTITVAVSSETGTAVGVNAGVDGNVLFSPHVGVGVFLRYAGGKVDLPSAKDLSVGGFQGGVGARIRF